MLQEPWRITLLGCLKAEQSHQSITRFRTRKAASLFAYLAFYPHRAHSREEIVDRFWPDDDPETGRAKLRLALTSLRHPLEPPGIENGSVLIADRTHVRLHPDAIQTDTAQLEAGLRAANTAAEGVVTRETEDARRVILGRAVALYSGDLLPGDYEEWVQPERERLKIAYLRALLELAELLAGAGKDEAALAYVGRAVAADPLQEDAHVVVIRLHLKAGRVAAAVRQYEELARILRQSLDMEPCPEAQKVIAPFLVDQSGREKTAKSARHRKLRSGDSASGSVRPEAAARPLLETVTASADATPDISSPSRLQPPVLRLPVPLNRHFGRDADIAALLELLTGAEFGPAADANTKPRSGSNGHEAPLLRGSKTPSEVRPGPLPRLVTLTGPGGTGKTRLAVETARRLQVVTNWTIAFVPLADVTDASRILPAIADALHLAPSGTQNALAQVAERLQNIPTLLVLDNFEQLTSHASATFQTLLTLLPELRCLITSRHRLALPGERMVPVLPLPVPDVPDVPSEGEKEKGKSYQSDYGASDVLFQSPSRHNGGGVSGQGFLLSPFSFLLEFPSVALFLDRAQAVRADFQLTPRNAEAVAQLCARLEGIPLALELAAVWIGALTPAQMLSRLEKRFDLLVSRKKDRVPRHQTLHATIAWSYDLLSPDLQACLARLSVFRGGWSEEAVQAVCQVPHALHTLVQLRERSLIVTEESEDGASLRFRLLDSIRDFAEEQLAEDEERTLRQRHAVFYLELAEEADGDITSARQMEMLARLEAEHSNIRAAMNWYGEDTEGAVPGLRLATAMQVFWWTRGYLDEGRARLAAALARPGIEAFPAEQCKALTAAGILANIQNDYSAARDYYAQCLPLAHAMHNEPQAAVILGSMGNVARKAGDYDSAESLYAECLQIAERVGQQGMAATCIGNLGLVAQAKGDYAAARRRYAECLARQQARGNTQGITVALTNLASLLAVTGDFTASHAYNVECLRLCREIGDQLGIAYALEIFGQLAVKQAWQEQAIRLFAGAAALRAKLGTPLTAQEAADLERDMIPLREAISAEMFAELWQRGMAEPVEQMLDVIR